MIYALVSAGASALASALGASEAGSAAGASAVGSASEEVQRVCNDLVTCKMGLVFLNLPGCPSGAA